MARSPQLYHPPCMENASLSLSEPLLLSAKEEDEIEISNSDLEAASLTTYDTNSSESSLSRNVKIILIYTWFIFAGRSIWNQNVLATYAFLLQDGDPKAIGFLTASMGLSQLVASFPSAILADKYRRDYMLRVASLVGVAAVLSTLVALYSTSYIYLIVALCIWGCYWGIANTSISALFADSIKDGQRAHYFTKRSILINFGNVAGPLISLAMFLALGDKWTIRDCSIVMAVGQVLCLPAFLLLLLLNDKYAVHHDQQEQEAQPAMTTTISSDLTLPLLGDDDESDCCPSEGHGGSSNASSDHQDEQYDARRLSFFLPCLPKERSIAILVAMADVTAGLASGMSIRYFAIFLYDNLKISPVKVQILYVIAPLIQASLMKVAELFARKYGGRCQIAVLFKWTGITFMLAMVHCYRQEYPVWVVCALLLFRTAFMNSTSALTKSVLFDHVPSNERAKWGALESLNMFSWSGSAALGGILVEYKGLVFNFLITASLQFIATMPFLLLSVFGRKKNNGSNNSPRNIDNDSMLSPSRRNDNTSVDNRRTVL